MQQIASTPTRVASLSNVNIEGGSIVNASDGRPPYAIFRSNVTKTALAE